MHFSFRRSLAACLALPLFLSGCTGKTEDVRIVLCKEVTDRLGALRVTLWVTLFGAATMVPVGWLEARAANFTLSDITIDAWVAIVFLGVGFETTAPTIAAAILQAEAERLSNFSVLSLHKLTPPATRAR